MGGGGGGGGVNCRGVNGRGSIVGGGSQLLYLALGFGGGGSIVGGQSSRYPIFYTLKEILGNAYTVRHAQVVVKHTLNLETQERL